MMRLGWATWAVAWVLGAIAKYGNTGNAYETVDLIASGLSLTAAMVLALACVRWMIERAEKS